MRAAIVLAIDRSSSRRAGEEAAVGSGCLEKRVEIGVRILCMNEIQHFLADPLDLSQPELVQLIGIALLSGMAQEVRCVAELVKPVKVEFQVPCHGELRPLLQHIQIDPARWAQRVSLECPRAAMQINIQRTQAGEVHLTSL